MLNRWSDDIISGLLDDRRRAIERMIQSEQDKLAKIELAQRVIRSEKIAVHYSVSIKPIPSYSVLSLRRVVPDYYAEGLLWKEMAAFAAAHRIPISDNTFTIYHDADYRETDVDMEICAPVAWLGKDGGGFTFRHTEPVSVMAYTMVRGPFENIAGAYRAFADWLQEHSQYRMGGHSRQMVHRGPWNEEAPEHYLTEIQIPLETK